MNKQNLLTTYYLLKVHTLVVQRLIRYNSDSQGTHSLLRRQSHIQFIKGQCNQCFIVI